MARNQDARPFVDLLKDSEEFKAKFDEDIKKCINFLDAKITALICDPDSLGNQLRGIKQNPLVEFSKAKYDIFIGTKALMSEMEREWLKYISEMKKLFIENVEIFLAATKLEVKLPSNEFQSSPGFMKSPRKQEQSYITSSIYPIINTFAKNVAALSSPLRGRDSPQKKTPQRISNDFQVSNSREISDDESKDTDCKLMRAAVRITKDKVTEAAAKGEMDTDESESEHRTPRSSGRFNKSSSSGLNSSRLSSGKRSKSGSDIELSLSPALNRSRSSSGQRSEPSVERKMNNFLGRNQSKSSSEQRSASISEKRLSRSGKGKSSSTSEEDEKPAEVKLKSSDPSPRRGRLSKESRISAKQEVSTTEETESQTDNETSKSSSKGRKGKQASKSEPKESPDTNPKRGRSSTMQSKSSAKQNLSTTEESETQIGDETSKFSLRERKRRPPFRGRQSSKVDPKVKQKVNSTEESEMSQIHADNEPSKTSKGRQSSKDESKDNNVLSKTPNRPTRSTAVEIRQSDKSVPPKTPNRASRRIAAGSPESAHSPKKINLSNSVESIESESSHTSLKRGRARPPAKQKSSATKHKSSSIDESTVEEVEEAIKALPRKQTERKSTKNKSKDTNEMSELLGRAGGKDSSAPSLKKSNLMTNNESGGSGIPKSPKKVTFTKEHDISDDLDLDIYTPAKHSKPAVRRKTLLPNLDDVSDISPEIPTRTKGKRKTIGGVSDLKAVTPSKRLRVSESKKKNMMSAQADDEADDNLLDSNGNYSEWIPLKNVDAKIPTRPAVYEIKVWRAKKSAYIGCCESLRQTLTLYKLRQNSGHKHLDKFIDRNMNDIQIRYEAISSLDAAKSEVKNRINRFISQYNTTPAYN